MIRSTCVSTKYSNINKKELINKFINDYSEVVKSIINDICINGYKNNKICCFNLEKRDLNLDSNLDNEYLKQFNTHNFTQRMMQACGTQASSIIRSCTSKAKRIKYVMTHLMSEGVDCCKLQQKLDKTDISIPNFNVIYPQIDNRFFDIEEDVYFDKFINIKLYSKISVNIPFKKHKHYIDLEKKGKLLNSIRLHNENISFSFELPDIPKRTVGSTIGADQGIITTLTLSDRQVTKVNNHGYDLNKIIRHLNRKRKGSKNYKQTQDHRLNYINWSINQLDFSNIKTLNLEKLYQIRKGKNSGKFLSSFTYTLIKKKLEAVSETEGFGIMEIANSFRSQRCSECGWTLKSNRKGKLFICKICGFATDADLNASYNLEDNSLYTIPAKVRLDKINRTGFFWNSEGLLNLNKEFIVPYVNVKSIS